MKIAIVLISILFSLAPPATSPGQRNEDEGMVGFGNQFYDKCASVESLSKENTEQETLTAMFCLGYVEGLTHGIIAADIQRRSQTFCLPSTELTNQQLVRIVRKYIAEHPEKAHEVTAILAVEALRKAFPCKG